jgi:branched-chain amino acid transport system ATP-binding protein
MSNVALSVQNLNKAFGGVAATQDVSMDFQEGSLTAIIGPNGAGKTTFFNLISGALKPDSGKVLLKGADITAMSSAEIVTKGIGRAFQVAKLFKTLTVEESLRAALMSPAGKSANLTRRFPIPETRERADETMDLLGLTSKAKTICGNLSHGDQKLMDIALALAMKPSVLLLDEPVAGMGPEERTKMIETVYRLWQKGGLTLVFIEHDMDIVFRIAQYVNVLCYGKLLAQGTPDQIRNNPAVIEAYLGVAHGEAA